MSFEPNTQNIKLMQQARSASKLLKALANQHRFIILCHIKQREYSVGELEKATKLSQSALSQHLAILRKERLVVTRRSSQIIFYRLARNQTNNILDNIRQFLVGDDTNLTKNMYDFSMKSSTNLPALF